MHGTEQPRPSEPAGQSGRMLLLDLLPVACMALGALGLLAINEFNDGLKAPYLFSATPAVQIDEISRLNASTRQDLAYSVASAKPDEISQSLNRIEANTVAIDKTWDAYLNNRLSPEEASIAKKLGEDRAKLMQEGLQPAVAALRANNQAEARRLVLEKIPELQAPVRHALETLMKLQANVGIIAL
jgi:methyl-accepting chemotaxis protein